MKLLTAMEARSSGNVQIEPHCLASTRVTTTSDGNPVYIFLHKAQETSYIARLGRSDFDSVFNLGFKHLSEFDVTFEGLKTEFKTVRSASFV